jgi:hypothetical protein
MLELAPNASRYSPESDRLCHFAERGAGVVRFNLRQKFVAFSYLVPVLATLVVEGTLRSIATLRSSQPYRPRSSAWIISVPLVIQQVQTLELSLGFRHALRRNSYAQFGRPACHAPRSAGLPSCRPESSSAPRRTTTIPHQCARPRRLREADPERISAALSPGARLKPASSR